MGTRTSCSVVTTKVKHKVKSLAILGKTSTLAQALLRCLGSCYDIKLFGREDCDFTNANDIDRLAKTISGFDVIINCVGVKDQNSWNSMLINAVAPAKLIEQLIYHDSTSQLILVGSHAAAWTSWPNIELERLWYNISKETLQSFVMGIDHSHKSKLSVSLLNCTRFKSNMSNNTGHDIDKVVQAINTILTAVPPPLVYELGDFCVD